MTKFANKQDYTDLQSVRDAYPSAAEIIPVEGGWMVCEYATDAETWRNQI